MQTNVQPLIEPCPEAMRLHLEHLFGGFLDGCHDGLIEIAYTDAQDHKLRHARLFGTDEIDEAAEFAAQQNKIPQQNVYVGAALRKADALRDKRASDTDILCLPAYYADLDESGTAQLAKQRYRGCPPTLVVITGRKPHIRAQLWWRQEIPERDHLRMRQQTSALAIALGGDRTVVNPSRVMRLAGSIAWPVKENRVLERTELQTFSDGRPLSYAEGQLAKAFPYVSSNTLPTGTTPTLNIGSTDPLSVASILQNIRSGAQWHNNLLRLVGHWVARGWSDAEILTAAESLTLPPYRIEQTRREAGQMILGARAKWAVKDPDNKVEDNTVAPLVPEFLCELNIALLPKRHWILGRSLLRGYLSLLVAPPGVGKSTFSLMQAIAICIGMMLTGQSVYESGKVWVHNNEDDRDELKRRIAAILQHYSIPFASIKDSLAVTSGADRPFMAAKKDQAGRVIRQPDIEACIAQIKAHNIKLFIVDPFIETHEVEENSNEEIKIVAQLYREIAQKADCAVLLVHHTSKPQQGSSDGHAGSMHTARGASALVGVARIVQTLFGMSARDAEKLGIDDKDRHLYIRLDDAKANLSLASPTALWFKRIGITIANGDEVGVLEPVDFSAAVAKAVDEEQGLHKTIIACLLVKISEQEISLNAAAKILAWGEDTRFHKYRETDAKGYHKATRPLREAIAFACRANITIASANDTQGFTLDSSVRPARLKRFRIPFNPLSQPEFMEDDHAE